MKVHAWKAILAAYLLGIAVFWPSLAAAVRLASTGSTAGVVLILPAAGLLAALFAILRGGPAGTLKLEPAMLGAVPLLLAAALLMTVGPARLGFDFWRLRLDLVAWVCFTFAALFLVTGVRATTRHGAMFVAVATLPPLTIPLIALIEGPLATSVRAATSKLAVAFPLGVTEISTGLFEDGQRHLVAIGDACAGVDALGLVLGACLVAFVALRGAGWRKIVLTLFALVLLWVLNVVRTTSLLAVAGAGSTRLFDALHTGVGLGIVALVTIAMVLAARRLGLGFDYRPMRGHITTATRTHVVTTIVALALTTVTIGAGTTAFADEGLNGVGVSSPVRLSLSDAPGSKGDMSFDVPGWEVRPDDTYPWLETFFGSASHSSSFTMLREGEAPVWVQAIAGTSRRKLDKYAPLDCFVAHGSKIVRVRRVELPGGAGILVDQRLDGKSFSALSWSQPAILPNGEPGHIRLVVMSDAEAGNDQRIPTADGPVQEIAFGIMNVLTIAPDRSAKGAAFGPSGRRVIAAANDMLAAN